MKYRKKPVVIEAIRVRDALAFAKNDWRELPQWVRDAYDSRSPIRERRGLLFLQDAIEVITPEGTMTAGIEDWLICGVKGELYPCKPDIFAATYEPVEEP